VSDDRSPSGTGAIRRDLVRLGRALGDETRGLAILGEGNVSADLGDGTFLVKASGSSLSSLDDDDLVRVEREAALDAVDALDAFGERPPDPAVADALRAATVDPGAAAPSVETFLHALCLAEPGVRWVGHVHAIALGGILCSAEGATPLRRHVLPDAVVVCGPEPAVVPYVDPGHALALRVRDELRRYRAAHGAPPRLLLMESHGPVALGATARQVEAILLMAEKWARIVTGARAFGGPAYLEPEDVARIDGRADEAVRRRRIAGEEA
jgi:rhamnose utilization protein RhaD (predicted bifunctional aldolase and dehydrogenase)